jgi:hypothetical protein
MGDDMLTIDEALALVRKRVPDVLRSALYAATYPERGYRGLVLPAIKRGRGLLLVRRRDVLRFARRLEGVNLPKRKCLEVV